jgi:hypothetical protein
MSSEMPSSAVLRGSKANCNQGVVAMFQAILFVGVGVVVGVLGKTQIVLAVDTVASKLKSFF